MSSCELARHPEGDFGIDREVGGVEDEADLLGLPRLLGRPQSQDWTMSAAQHGDGHAPRQQPAHSGPPVRPHDDQVAAELLGHSQDLYCGFTFVRLVVDVNGMVRSVIVAQLSPQSRVTGLVGFGGMELDAHLSVVDRVLWDPVRFDNVQARQAGFHFRTASEQAARKASFEFSEKSAANRMVAKGCMRVLRFWEGEAPSEPLWHGPAALSSQAPIVTSSALFTTVCEARSFVVPDQAVHSFGTDLQPGRRRAQP